MDERQGDKASEAVIKQEASGNAEQNHSIIYVRKKFGQLRIGIGKVFNPVVHMFSHDPSAAWTMVFTGILALYTIKLFIVTKQADETTKAVQRAYVSFQEIRPDGKIPTEDLKQVKIQQVLTHWEN